MGTASNQSRIWIFGTAIGCLILLVISWFFLVSPQLSNASSLNDQKAQTQSQNAVLEAKVNHLNDLSKNMGQLVGQLKEAQDAIPSGSGLSDFTRQLSVDAAQAQVKLTSVSAGGPVAVNAAPQVATAGGGAPATVPSTSVYSITITVIASGPTANLQAFLRRIQDIGPRRALVTSATYGATGSGGAAAGLAHGANLTAIMQIFTSPMSPDQQAAINKILNGQ